jgi:hypothetical protein
LSAPLGPPIRICLDVGRDAASSFKPTGAERGVSWPVKIAARLRKDWKHRANSRDCAAQNQGLSREMLTDLIVLRKPFQ